MEAAVAAPVEPLRSRAARCGPRPRRVGSGAPFGQESGRGLVIADIGNLSQHPSFVLQPLGIAQQGAIGLSINTDNPLTFSTCLANEYHYLYAALLRQGVRSQGGIDWLERARRTG